ncbi:hypothetical protein GCM10009819_00270 [Agromyces tropicus]|uniref:DUF4375 domain-containing protein n=1 Tax=Agromyces tropicus TaxID=555371 RepID=A0ABN2TUG0_9MICO
MNEHEPNLPVGPESEPESGELVIREATLEERIEAGITEAAEQKSELKFDTARDIAEALSRATGGDSVLARFADSGTGSYLALREEYLSLYNDPGTPPEAKRWIHWFGTFLVAREGTSTGRQFMNEQLDPELARTLLRTKLPVSDGEQYASVPATLNARDLIALAARLEALDEYQEPSFRAFLTLPDVNAADPNLLESFRESYVASYNYVEDAVRDLAELAPLEADLRAIASDHGLPEAAITLDYELTQDHVREVYDIVAEGWQVHVFSK